MNRCYRCGTPEDIKCCGMCGKYMCPKCRGNWLQRSLDAAYEKAFGYAPDWFPEGRC